MRHLLLYHLVALSTKLVPINSLLTMAQVGPMEAGLYLKTSWEAQGIEGRLRKLWEPLIMSPHCRVVLWASMGLHEKLE